MKLSYLRVKKLVMDGCFFFIGGEIGLGTSVLTASGFFCSAIGTSLSSASLVHITNSFEVTVKCRNRKVSYGPLSFEIKHSPRKPSLSRCCFVTSFFDLFRILVFGVSGMKSSSSSSETGGGLSGLSRTSSAAFRLKFTFETVNYILYYFSVDY